MARVPFDMVDVTKTAVLRDQKRREVLCLYENRLLPLSPLSTLSQLRESVKQQIMLLVGEQDFESLTEEQLEALTQFIPKGESEQALKPSDALRVVKSLLSVLASLKSWPKR